MVWSRVVAFPLQKKGADFHPPLYAYAVLPTSLSKDSAFLLNYPPSRLSTDCGIMFA
jgi:hypothetical protein